MSSFPVVIGDQQLPGPTTGVATYSAAVVRALELAGRSFMTVDASLGGSRPARSHRWIKASLPGERRSREVDGRLRIADIFREAQVYFDVWRRPLVIGCGGAAGVVHWTYPVPLRIAGWRNVYTIHDTIPLDQPDLTPISQRRHRRLLAAIVRRADRVVTVSATAKADILRHFTLSPDTVVDLGQAVQVAHDLSTPLPSGISPRAYLLHCGSIEPRKNVARLIEAWQRSGCGLTLVLAGPPGWRAEPIIALAHKAGVVTLGYLDRNTMLALIAKARALVMPSLAEGFGLPVAEALTLGTPVITSDRGALAETAGGAALTVDPEDPTALAAAIRRVAKDNLLCQRLMQAGKARETAFSPHAFGQRLAAFYDELGTDG